MRLRVRTVPPVGYRSLALFPLIESLDRVLAQTGDPRAPPRRASENVSQNDVCADPVEGVTGPAHTFAEAVVRRPAPVPYGPGAFETLLAAFEKRPRRTFLRKKSAMMMAIARKPSRIAYSVVVWPSSRSRSSCTQTCSAITGRIRMSVIWRFLFPCRVGHMHSTFS